jgi:hypothetical protein
LIEREQHDRRRQRILASFISLVLLLLLLSAWCATRNQTQEGHLTSIATGTVQVAINPTGEAGASGSATVTGSGTPRNFAGGFQRESPLLTEVLGQQVEPTPSETALPIVTSTTQPGTLTGTETPAPILAATETPAVGTATATVEATATAGAAATATTPSGGGTTSGPPILTFDGVLAPGSYATGGVLVSNSGGSDFSYSVTLDTEGDEGFGSELRFRIFVPSGDSCTFSGQPTQGNGLLAAQGDIVYDGHFTPGNVGNPAVETASTDLVLAAGKSQALCMEIFFPWDAGDEFQGDSISGTFTFTAKTPGT